LVDAAQSLGLIDIDVHNPHIDMLAAPGHKGLGGMLGTGILYVRSELSPKLHSPWIGGTGHYSDRLVDEFPWSESAESGNLNIPAIASLGEGVRWLRENHDAEKLRLWTGRLIDAVEREKRLRWIGSKESRGARRPLQRVPVVSCTHADLSCHEMAMLLDTTLGIEARSGFHCAAMIHRYLGTEHGGTLRMSLCHTSTDADVDAAIEGIKLLGSC
jgi:selenocysteine lyase/cysteine desulfurase